MAFADRKWIMLLLTSPGWVTVLYYTVMFVVGWFAVVNGLPGEIGKVSETLNAHIGVYGAFVEVHEESQERLASILEKLEARQARMEKRELTVRGLGTAGTFGGTIAYIRVNSESAADVYHDGDKVRVTNRSVPGSPSEVFEVRGEWAHLDREVLVNFSRAACDILEVEGIIDVTLEPDDLK